MVLHFTLGGLVAIAILGNTSWRHLGKLNLVSL